MILDEAIKSLNSDFIVVVTANSVLTSSNDVCRLLQTLQTLGAVDTVTITT